MKKTLKKFFVVILIYVSIRFAIWRIIWSLYKARFREYEKVFLAKLRDSNNITLVITKKIHMDVLIHMDMHLPITDTQNIK